MGYYPLFLDCGYLLGDHCSKQTAVLTAAKESSCHWTGSSWGWFRAALFFARYWPGQLMGELFFQHTAASVVILVSRAAVGDYYHYCLCGLQRPLQHSWDLLQCPPLIGYRASQIWKIENKQRLELGNPL